MRNTKLGDTMPVNRNVKFGDMRAGESHLSDEYHDMMASSPVMSEKYVDLEASSGHMSDKWVEQHPSPLRMGDEWCEMKQESRVDPYSMAPSSANRVQPFKSMSKEKPNNKVSRQTQHTEFGSTREL